MIANLVGAEPVPQIVRFSDTEIAGAALIVATIALIISGVAAYYTRMQGVGTRDQARVARDQDRERRRPRLRFTPAQEEYHPVLTTLQVELFDPEDVDSVSIELLDPQPHYLGPGFGHLLPVPPETAVGRVTPHSPVRFPEPLFMAGSGSDPVTIRYTARRGDEAWTGTAQIEMPYDLMDSFG